MATPIGDSQSPQMTSFDKRLKKDIERFEEALPQGVAAAQKANRILRATYGIDLMGKDVRLASGKAHNEALRQLGNIQQNEPLFYQEIIGTKGLKSVQKALLAAIDKVLKFFQLAPSDFSARSMEAQEKALLATKATIDKLWETVGSDELEVTIPEAYRNANSSFLDHILAGRDAASPRELERAKKAFMEEKNFVLSHMVFRLLAMSERFGDIDATAQIRADLRDFPKNGTQSAFSKLLEKSLKGLTEQVRLP